MGEKCKRNTLKIYVQTKRERPPCTVIALYLTRLTQPNFKSTFKSQTICCHVSAVIESKVVPHIASSTCLILSVPTPSDSAFLKIFFCLKFFQSLQT